MKPTRSVLRLMTRFAAIWLALAVVSWLSLLVVGEPVTRFSDELTAWPLLDGWARWDAQWYASIARDGYFFRPDAQSSVAFFPLYPLTIRLVMQLTALGPLTSGIIVTSLCGAGAFLTFDAWARLIAPTNAALAGWVLAVWPLAFFLYGAAYSDALFLLLVTSSFLSLERRQLALAVALGILATASRPVGVPVVIGLLARNLELRRREGPLRIIDFAPLLCVLGLGAYMAFQWKTFGSPTAFVETQRGWNQAPGPRTWFKLNWVQGDRFIERLPRSLMHLGLAGLCVAMIPRAWKTLGAGYAIYVGAVLAMPLASSIDFIGLGRYSMAAFPAMACLAGWLREKPLRLRAWFVISVTLLIICMTKFSIGRYIS